MMKTATLMTISQVVADHICMCPTRDEVGAARV